MTTSIKIFDEHFIEYDLWYEKNRAVYVSELQAIKPHLTEGISLEIGVGTGRFAWSLGIKFGLDLSFNMLKMAKERGIRVVKGDAEKLPFRDSIFDLVLMVVTICFLKDPVRALREVNRVLKNNGKIIVAFVDRESFLGSFYLSKKEQSKFYKEANFYSVPEVLELLEIASFSSFYITQTVFRLPREILSPEPILEGYGKGGFVVVSGLKTN